MRLLVALAAVALAVPAHPDDRAATPAAPTRAQLDVRLNDVAAGESLVLLDDGDVWMAVADLEAYGLAGLGGTRRTFAGRELVSLRSLAPRLGYRVDERALALLLTAGPELLGRRQVDLGERRPVGVIQGGQPSGFANYAVQGTMQGQVSAFGELGASVGTALLWSGFSAPAGGTPVRALTALTYDRPERLERWTAGDAAFSMGGLGSAGVVGGLSYGREFSLDPYLSQAPRPATTAFASTPSTLEVYVDGALVRREAVAPGTLDLTNLPVAAGTGSVRTVIRDAYGREQAYDVRAGYGPGLLAPGLTDFEYHLGALRDVSGVDSFGYGRAVALGRYRAALGDAVTGGARLEGALDRVMAGPTLTLGTLAGQLDLELAGSVMRGRGGAGASAAWSWMGRRASGGLRTRLETPMFANATLDLWSDRALVQAAAFGSASLTRWLSLGLELAGSRYRDTGNGGSATVRGDVGLGGGVAVLSSVTFATGAGAGVSGQVMLSWSPGAQTTAHVSAMSGPAGATANAGVQRALPIGTGYGYRVEATAGGPAQSGTALLQGQTQFGRYEAEVDRLATSTYGSLSVSGGVVAAGGRLFATRPVEQSYALLRVGVPDVHGYLENQEAGTTDGQGDLLVPALQPRYANRVSIRAADVPLDYEVGRLEQLVAPPQRGCVVARFDVSPVRAVMGRLLVDDGVGQATGTVPAHGELTVDVNGRVFSSPTTAEGKFFLERVGAGRHPAEVVWGGGACRFTLEIPDRAGLIDLGVVHCSRDLRLAGTPPTEASAP